jgi:hypothetical protein
VIGEVVVRGACHGQHMALARRHSAKGAANLGLYSAVRQAAVTAQEQEWLARLVVLADVAQELGIPFYAAPAEPPFDRCAASCRVPVALL